MPNPSSMNAGIDILVFGPGLPSAGQPSVCRIEQNGISLPAYNQLIRFAALQPRVGSFDHNQLQLSWQHQGESWLLIPVNQAAQKALIRQLPKSQLPGLGKWRQATFNQSLVWKTAAGTIGALALAAIMLIWQYDTAVAWLAGRVSVATEYRIGQSVLANLKSQTALLDKGLAIDAVKKIGDRLTKGSPYQYQWHVSTDKAINAFALPGGIVIVNKGLIEKADSANEVAGVLAHEIQHVEQRHALKNMITSSGIAAAVLVVLGDANAVMMILAHQVSAQYFSRQTESEADMKGVELLTQAKVNPAGLVEFFKKIQPVDTKKTPVDGKKNAKGNVKKPGNESSEEGRKSTVLEWVSSHPDTLSRINAIDRYINSHPCVNCETLSWDKKAILASLEKTQDKKVR